MPKAALEESALEGIKKIRWCEDVDAGKGISSKPELKQKTDDHMRRFVLISEDLHVTRKFTVVRRPSSDMLTVAAASDRASSALFPPLGFFRKSTGSWLE